MNAKLIVKNFGPIRDAELQLQKTTVLIGPQGSGKSTLAKLVAIFNDVNFYMDELSPVAEQRQYFENYLLEGYFSPDSEIKWNHDFISSHYNSGNFISVLNAQLNKSKLNLQINKKIEKFNFSNYGYNELNSFIRENHKELESEQLLTIYSQAKSKIEDWIPGYFLRSTYIPTERYFFSFISNSISGLLRIKVALPQYFYAFGNEFEIARNAKREYGVNFLDILYRYEDGTDKIILPNNQSLQLKDSASGFQSVVPLKIIVDNASNEFEAKWFGVEEPELNLYPTTQKSLIYYLADRCTKGRNELLMTTHSPYVLSSLNILLLAYKVWQKHPGKEAEIAAIVPKESWLNPEKFAAYYVADGTVRSIIDSETGLINDNELDEISEELAGELDALLYINRSKTEVNESIN